MMMLCQSLPSRGAWIETKAKDILTIILVVAPFAGSVD